MKELSFEEKIKLLNNLIGMFKRAINTTGICRELLYRYKVNYDMFPELLGSIEYYQDYSERYNYFNITASAYLWNLNSNGNKNRIEFLTNIKVMLQEEHRLGNIK